jgi:hypothetical protein
MYQTCRSLTGQSLEINRSKKKKTTKDYKGQDKGDCVWREREYARSLEKKNCDLIGSGPNF